MKKFNYNQNIGITLISLVITIILLLILSGITLLTLTGENGILTKTKNAKEIAEISDIIEKTQMEILEEQAMNNGNLSKSQFIEILKKYFIETTIPKEEDLPNDMSIATQEVTTKEIYGNYNIQLMKIWNGTFIKVNNTNGVSIGEIFDSTGEIEGKLHIGDFINYTAGNWTQEDLDKIKNSGAKIEANNDSSTFPSSPFQFGGFQIGDSKDGNAKPNAFDDHYASSYTDYVFVKDKKTGSPITGWRLFDIEDDGTIVLISAGCPEDYFHPNSSNYGYISEYILTNNININANKDALNLGTTYLSRNWDMYINTDYNAQSATTLSRTKLDIWYSKYMNLSNTDDIWNSSTFQAIYNTKYESLIDNYCYHWLSTPLMRQITIYNISFL